MTYREHVTSVLAGLTELAEPELLTVIQRAKDLLFYLGVDISFDGEAIMFDGMDVSRVPDWWWTEEDSMEIVAALNHMPVFAKCSSLGPKIAKRFADLVYLKLLKGEGVPIGTFATILEQNFGIPLDSWTDVSALIWQFIDLQVLEIYRQHAPGRARMYFPGKRCPALRGPAEFFYRNRLPEVQEHKTAEL